MGSERRVRRQERARNFGRRHPVLTIAILSVLLAGVVLICVAQLIHGAYLGRGWLVAALAGIAAAVSLGAAALVTNRRHSRVADRVLLAWLVPALMSVSAFRFPFPKGPYGSAQAVFDMVHAALLGYLAVTMTAVVALINYLAVRSRGRTHGRGQAARRGRAPRRAARVRKSSPSALR